MIITDEMIDAAKSAYWHEVHHGGGYSDECYRVALAAGLAASPAGVRVKAQAFSMGDMVRKRSGSWWEGRVVGFYSTEQTPDGVCVQLDSPMGPVQIYPASAMELVEDGVAAADEPAKPGAVPDDEDRMTRIDDLIEELQAVSSRFGNTCVYIRRGGMSWGAVALNRCDDDKRNGVFELQAQHDREIALLSERIENLKTERKQLRAALATTEDKDNG